MFKDELENKVSLALCLESSSAKKLGPPLRPVAQLRHVMGRISGRTRALGRAA